MSVPSKIDARDPLVLDRLVDGELTDADERAVIAQLSQMPDGWRRCALAFLEARCWQRAATHVQELSNPQPSCGQERVPQRWPIRLASLAPNPKSIRWSSALALCGLFLFAFAVGTFLPHPWHLLSSWNRTAQPPEDRPAVNMRLADNEGSASDQSGSQDQATSQDLLLGNLTLVDNSGHQFNVPVYDWNKEVAEQLMYRSQPLSSEFFQQLKRHQVRTHQRYVPVKLQDGRQVVVPIQEVNIGPVAGTAY